MFEDGEFVKITQPIYVYVNHNDRNRLVFNKDDVVQIKIWNNEFKVYCDAVNHEIFLYKEEIQKIHKNNVTIVMRE
jgi:hypothetical protein